MSPWMTFKWMKLLLVLTSFYLLFFLGLYWARLLCVLWLRMTTMSINPRSKGKRGEYLARDIFRDLGWVADRVPSSGAAPGFKGDVTLKKGDLKLVVEVKNKREEFKELYRLLNTLGSPVKISCNGTFIVMSYSFHDLGFESSEPKLFEATPPGRTLNKIIRMRALLKTADFLMVRNDRSPFIYIRYFGELA